MYILLLALNCACTASTEYILGKSEILGIFSSVMNTCKGGSLSTSECSECLCWVTYESKFSTTKNQRLVVFQCNLKDSTRVLYCKKKNPIFFSLIFLKEICLQYIILELRACIYCNLFSDKLLLLLTCNISTFSNFVCNNNISSFRC